MRLWEMSDILNVLMIVLAVFTAMVMVAMLITAVLIIISMIMEMGGRNDD